MTSLTIDQEQVVEAHLMVLMEKLEKKDYDLPPLPQIANQVLAISSDPQARASKLSAVIEQDPILTAKIFQISNSVLAGSTREIISLQQAIAWLGLNTVAGSAFTLSVQAGVFKVQGYECEVKGLWGHMLTTAFYAKSIARLIGCCPEAAFLSGLLHAIGKPLVVHMVNQNQQHSSSLLPWTTIMTLIRESYVEMGRVLGEAWGFPDSVMEAINLHQDHSYHLASSPTKSAAITCLANHFASHCLDPESHPEEILRDQPVVRALQVSGDVLDELFQTNSTVQAQVDSMLT